ncbi:phosphatidylinositol N-acetylglucosaminyltransferase subunit P [Cimex lectularius]|uniref:PIG-P domain-containing protein n=1 Tax=Cimex lectularius TaxID=79782 RepID=A0A8I6TEU9_CIMLE|nr:phosphatidylinositol N-acetylglucosaminyltransferase subunit P [Cimex lectularius]
MTTTHDFPHNSPAPTPSRANYGFALYLASSTAFIVFCFWALDFDKSVGTRLGLTYLPQVYWAVALPIFVLVTIAFTGLILYPSINLLSNRPFCETHVAQPTAQETLVPPLVSISMAKVSRRLYLENNED